MPASRARTATCSAPLEWPSRPGLPTRILGRRPSFLVMRSTSARRSSMPWQSLRAAWDTPVGARYSPKPWRSTAPHSPVVTPALAQAIEAGMMLRPAPAARAGGARAGRHALGVARRAPGPQPRDLLAFDVIGDGEDRILAGGERRFLGLDEAVDADH